MREVDTQRSHHQTLFSTLLSFLFTPRKGEKTDRKKTIRGKTFRHACLRQMKRRKSRNKRQENPVVVVSILINRISHGIDFFNDCKRDQRDVYIMDPRSGKYQSKLYNRRETMKAG